jgi:hypothetical protein
MKWILIELEKFLYVIRVFLKEFRLPRVSWYKGIKFLYHYSFLYKATFQILLCVIGRLFYVYNFTIIGCIRTKKLSFKN